MLANDVIVTHSVTDGERDRIRSAVESLAAGHDWVLAVYLYGSAASSARPARDIDIGILTDGQPVKFGALSVIATELSDRTGLRAIPFDVRIIDRAGPLFLNNLLLARTSLFARDAATRIEFEARAMSQWLDFRPHWTRVRAEVLERWGGG